MVSAQELDFVFWFRERPFSPNPDGSEREFSLDTLPLEYPVYGNTDFRSPALEIFQPEDGSRIVDLRFKDHRTMAGKPSLSGLPSTWVERESEAETLIIGLEDSKLDLRVELSIQLLPIIQPSRDRHGLFIAECLHSFSAA